MINKAVIRLEEAQKLNSIGVVRGNTMDVFLTSHGLINLTRLAKESMNARMLERSRINA
ncbi:MAG: hypothetical protein QMC11_04050 [Rhodospirillales bacterium]